MFHFGLTYLVQGNYYKKYVNKELTEDNIENEVMLSLTKSIEDLDSYIVTKEYSRKGNVPHYHVYVRANVVDINVINEIYPFGYVWCKTLQTEEHYINYITKYMYRENIVSMSINENNKELNILLEKIYFKLNNKVNKTKSIISKFIGMSIEEYIEKGNV